MKIKIVKPVSTDAGIYGGLPEEKVVWGKTVEGRYCNSVKGVYIKGQHFIDMGGLETCFIPDKEYLWGSYEEVVC